MRAAVPGIARDKWAENGNEREHDDHGCCSSVHSDLNFKR
jgi:hypothetical protein